METLGCPCVSVPHSVTLAGSKKKDKPVQLGTSFTAGGSFTAGAAGWKCRAPAIHLRGSTSDFSSTFTPEAFLR